MKKRDIDFGLIENIVVLTSNVQNQLAVPRFVDL